MAFGYSIAGYGNMIADSARLNAYSEALRHAIRPGSVLLDIGTGMGVFACLAHRLGAAKVYALDPNDSIIVAREIAAANGFSDKIEFIEKMSTQVTLPDGVDVIVSDLRGVLPLFENHLPSIIDARQRLLAPGGVLIPRCDALWGAVVEAADLYTRHTSPWLPNDCGFDMQPARRLLTNTWCKARIKPEQLLAEPLCWATLDYRTVETADVEATVNWTAAREGIAHGLGLWFDATLADGIGFSNAPSCPEVIYSNAFFPLSEPVQLAPGDTVSVRLRADLVGGDYVWCWDTCILDQGDSKRIKANFRQSTFLGTPLSPTQLHKRASTFVPTLGENGQVARLILEQMAAGAPLGEIASRIMAEFPGHFANRQEALTRVGELSVEYSE